VFAGEAQGRSGTDRVGGLKYDLDCARECQRVCTLSIQMGRMEGKVAFLTGAGTGIAKATAKAFAREGAKVAMFELNARAGESTAIEERRLTAAAVGCYVSK
jgi:hypothetical protein